MIGVAYLATCLVTGYALARWTARDSDDDLFVGLMFVTGMVLAPFVAACFVFGLGLRTIGRLVRR